jgi:hypothetical protein
LWTQSKAETRFIFLHCASRFYFASRRYDHIDIARFLLQHGANFAIKDKSGDTPQTSAEKVATMSTQPSAVKLPLLFDACEGVQLENRRSPQGSCRKRGPGTLTLQR